VRRVLIVTLALMATGAIIGAGLGALSLWAASAILGVGPNVGSIAEMLGEGAKVGALAGAVLAPVSAWSLTRYAPLWRAIVEPAVGTALGSVVGSAAASAMGGELAWSILGALLGFIVAAVRLRVAYRARSAPKDSIP
jgi:hypothetical protein